MIFEIKNPLSINQRTGNFSIPMAELCCKECSGFQYVGTINGTYVNVYVPVDIIRKAVFLSDNFKLNYFGVIEKDMNVQYMLLPKIQLINYMRTGKMYEIPAWTKPRSKKATKSVNKKQVQPEIIQYKLF